MFNSYVKFPESSECIWGKLTQCQFLDAPSSLVKRSKDPKLRQPIRNVKQAIRHFFRWGNVWNLGEFDHDLTVLTEIISLFQRKHPLLWPNYSVSELLPSGYLT